MSHGKANSIDLALLFPTTTVWQGSGGSSGEGETKPGGSEAAYYSSDSSEQ